MVIKNKNIRKVLHFFKEFLVNYLANNVINNIPFYFIRHNFYKLVCRIKIGKGTSIHMKTFIDGKNIIIGKNTVINRSCYLDGRGTLLIGDKVSISPHVHVITVSHNMNSPYFENVFTKVEIQDYAWIGSRAVILQGVIIGKGAVVGAGSVVTKDVAPFTFVAGVPAIKIKERNSNLLYDPTWFPLFD
jgi:acetyltransferase-like isoleucine patch superfamily enzyme